MLNMNDISGITAYRTWKRDGSADAMPIESAVANLHRYGTFERHRKHTISERLLAGEILETKLALFANRVLSVKAQEDV